MAFLCAQQDICKYCQSTNDAQIKVLQNLVLLQSGLCSCEAHWAACMLCVESKFEVWCYGISNHIFTDLSLLGLAF